MNPLETLQKEFENLPEIFQYAYKTFDINTSIKEIISTSTLSQDAQGQLINEIVLILLGITKKENLDLVLKKNLSLSSTQTQLLINKINSKLFTPLDAYIKELITQNGTADATKNNLAKLGIDITEEIPENSPLIPNATDTLHGIESPESIPMPRNSLFHAKTSTVSSHDMTHIPKPKHVPEPPQAIHHAPVGYGDQDPYHEPINPDDLV